jgi:hypothetical protein
MTDTRNDAVRSRIAEALERNAAMKDARASRAENYMIGHEPDQPFHPHPPAPVTRGSGPALTPVDLEWIRLLDPQNLDEADAVALRSMRARSSSDNERRLLDRVLRVDDVNQAEAARRAAIEDEIRSVETGIAHPIGRPDPDTRTGSQALEMRAASRVRDQIAEQIRGENERWRGDPRRHEDTQVWLGDRWELEGAADHERRIRAIEASREERLAKARVDVRTEMTNTRKAHLTELTKRKQELQAQLNNGNGG